VFRVLGFVILESKNQTLRRDLSRSKDMHDMRDSPRSNLGFAANMF